VYLRNSNTQGPADIRFFFGNPGDVPFAGDFDADGCDTVSIYRPSEQRFYIINQLGTDGGGFGAAKYSFMFGDPGDQPFVGDFNGNGQDTVGLHRESSGLVYFRNTNTTGIADNQFYFGDPGDRFMAGDWNGDGTDTPGLFRPSNRTVYLRCTNTQGVADETWTIGASGWLPVSGRLMTCASQDSIPVSECEALVDIYGATNGQGWRITTGWLAHPNPCAWHGPGCSQGHVNVLEFYDNGLTGSIPSEISDLPYLAYLMLSEDNLTGPIPPEIGNLTNLHTLTLSGNQLSGPIPPELDNLTNLQSLDLSDNQLSGSIPPELDNLTNLQGLQLQMNELSGPIPPELSLTNLGHLNLGTNKLSGSLPPELANLTNLGNLSLNDNQLSGSLPPELGNLNGLYTLWLQSNELSGPVPPGLMDLWRLRSLNLSGQTGCLTASTSTFASWLSARDPYWNDGCPG
jgi:hypothetical protein